MAYIDGYVIPVPDANRTAYRDFEAQMWPAFRDRGALSLVLGWGDDVPAGKHTDLARAVDLQPGETVVFGWMTWPDKATRDAAYAAMMEPDGQMPPDLPFDGKRMIYGGFVPLLTDGEIQ